MNPNLDLILRLKGMPNENRIGAIMKLCSLSFFVYVCLSLFVPVSVYVSVYVAVSRTHNLSLRQKHLTWWYINALSSQEAALSTIPCMLTYADVLNANITSRRRTFQDSTSNLGRFVQSGQSSSLLPTEKSLKRCNQTCLGGLSQRLRRLLRTILGPSIRSFRTLTKNLVALLP